MTITEIAHLHTLREVAKAARVKSQTVRSWIHVGVAGPRGVVKLAATKIGGHYLIHPDALAAFIDARNATPQTPLPASDASRRRRAEADRRALRERVG